MAPLSFFYSISRIADWIGKTGQGIQKFILLPVSELRGMVGFWGLDKISEERLKHSASHLALRAKWGTHMVGDSRSGAPGGFRGAGHQGKWAHSGA